LRWPRKDFGKILLPASLFFVFFLCLGGGGRCNVYTDKKKTKHIDNHGEMDRQTDSKIHCVKTRRENPLHSTHDLLGSGAVFFQNFSQVCVCICVCVYACMNLCVYVSMCMHMYICIRVCVCVSKSKIVCKRSTRLRC
jgi:hypothetical protein